MREIEEIGIDRWEEEKNQDKKKILKDQDFKKIIEPWVFKSIKSHALTSSKEIYGWLIGCESKHGDILVFSSVPCYRYLNQTHIGARPDPREVQELGLSLPDGLGTVGIYHSHPADIFHSSIDDSTLKNLAKYYPKMLSAVTNNNYFKGEEIGKNQTRWFQLDGSGKNTNEIVVYEKEISKKKYKFLECFVSISLDISIPISYSLNQEILQKVLKKFDVVFATSRLEILSKAKFKLRNLFGKSKSNSPSFTRYSIDYFNKKYKSGNIKIAKLPSRLNQSDKKYFTKGNYFTKINLDIKNTKSEIEAIQDSNSSSSSCESNKNFIEIVGNINILSIILLNRKDRSLKIKKIKEKLTNEVRDCLIQKISRGILILETPQKLQLVTSSPVIFPYPGILMKLNLILKDLNGFSRRIEQSIESNIEKNSDLKREHFPDINQIFNLEDENLDSLYKKAIIIQTSGKEKEAKYVIKMLKKIYEIRGNKEKVSKLDTVLDLYKI